MLKIRRFVRCAAQIRSLVDDALQTASQHFKDGDIRQCITSNLRIFEDKIPITVLNDGNMWLKVASARINTAFAYKLLGEFDHALDQVKEGIKLLDAHFTQCKPELCHALDLCAELYIAAGKHSEAQEYVSRSLEIKTSIYPQQSPHLVNSYNLQGAIHFAAGRLAEAEAEFMKSISICVNNYGFETPINQQLGVTLSNLAGIWRARDDWKKCIEAYTAVVTSFEAHFGESSWMTAQASVDLGLSLVNAGAPRAAKEHLVRGLGILVTTSGPSHPSAVAAMEALKATQNPAGEDAALECAFLSDLFRQVKIEKKGKVSGDLYILDRRGHVGGGHPFSQLK